jgi:hypothetical protein
MTLSVNRRTRETGQYSAKTATKKTKYVDEESSNLQDRKPARALGMVHYLE